MNRINYFVIAGVLAIVLTLTSAGVWAAPKFQGTVPPVPQIPVTGDCLQTVNMGTAIFTVQSKGCIIEVELVNDPSGKYVSAPKGKAFIGDTFIVTVAPEDTIIQVCYAYPPEFADKDAKIHRLNEDATPNAWVEVPAAVISDGTICVNSVAGVFALIGNP
jgi:hypothetical protein